MVFDMIYIMVFDMIIVFTIVSKGMNTPRNDMMQGWQNNDTFTELSTSFL